MIASTPVLEIEMARDRRVRKNARTLVSRRSARMITLVPYDPAWPRLFAEEAARLQQALGGRVLRIEHVGSTAVPGLAAKPVIDIQVSVASLEARAPLFSGLQQLGYLHVPLGDFDRVYPFFQRPHAWPASHHVHLCVAGGEQERRHLAFRDHLREHADAAASYLALKQRLAAAHVGDTFESRERYSLAKSEFVEAVLEQVCRFGGASDGREQDQGH